MRIVKNFIEIVTSVMIVALTTLAMAAGFVLKSAFNFICWTLSLLVCLMGGIIYMLWQVFWPERKPKTVSIFDGYEGWHV